MVRDMSYFDQLNQAVREALKSGQIGQPVFVRVTVTLAPVEADGWAAVGALVPVVQEWVGGPIQRVYAVESSGHRHAALALQFRNGASALLSSVSPATGDPGLDVLILGNRGGIYHEGLTCGPAPGALLPAPAERADNAIRKVIETAFRTGQPQAVPPEGEP